MATWVNTTLKKIGAGQEFTTWTAALAWLHSVRINPGQIVTLEFQIGTHDVASNPGFWHPEGRQVRIRGKGRDATFVRVLRDTVSGQVRSFMQVTGNACLGAGRDPADVGLDGMTIYGNGFISQGNWQEDDPAWSGEPARRTYGVWAVGNGGQVFIGPDMRIEKLYGPIICEGAGFFYLAAGGQYWHGGDGCILARGPVNIWARGVQVKGAGDVAQYNAEGGVAQGLGHNIIGEDGAHVDVCGAISTYAPSWGGHVSAQSFASVDAREMLVGFDPVLGTPSVGGGIAFRGLGGPVSLDIKGSVVRNCFGGLQMISPGMCELGAALFMDHLTGGFHIEAKQGAALNFGIYPNPHPVWEFDYRDLNRWSQKRPTMTTWTNDGGPTANENDHDAYIAPNAMASWHYSPSPWDNFDRENADFTIKIGSATRLYKPNPLKKRAVVSVNAPAGAVLGNDSIV